MAIFFGYRNREQKMPIFLYVIADIGKIDAYYVSRHDLIGKKVIFVKPDFSIDPTDLAHYTGDLQIFAGEEPFININKQKVRHLYVLDFTLVSETTWAARKWRPVKKGGRSIILGLGGK